MRCGIVLPTYLPEATIDDIRRVALLAEALGFDSVWTTDVVMLSRSTSLPYEDLEWSRPRPWSVLRRGWRSLLHQSKARQMATRMQITRLAQRIETLGKSNQPWLIVVDPNETKDQALARHTQQRGPMPRGLVTFISTGVPRSPDWPSW